MRIKQRFDSIHQESYLSIWRTYDRLRALEDAFFATWQYHSSAVQRATNTASERSTSPDTDDRKQTDFSVHLILRECLDRLENQAWIARSRSDADRRSVLVEITDEGIKLLIAMADGLSELHEKQLGHVQPAGTTRSCVIC
jgi:hypothetical protein